MKKISLFVFVGIIILFTGCRPKQYLFLEGFTQGTTFHITYADYQSRDLTRPVDSILDAFENSLSIYRPHSLISRINQNDSTAIADDLFTRVFNKAMEVSAATDGAFDITVGPLVNAWGFGKDSIPDVDSTIVDSLLQFVGYHKVKLQNDRVIKSDPRIFIDVNALAQGFTCDVVASYFESIGIHTYLIEIGGEILAKGRNPDGNSWRIGIDKPIVGNSVPGYELQTVIKLRNKALATSGNYRKFHLINGIRYAHEINPHTGYPVMQNLLSASIIAKDGITADAYATACMVMGLEKSKELLQQHHELKGYLVYGDKQGEYEVWHSPGLSLEAE